jgi:hypothetical protein
MNMEVDPTQVLLSYAEFSEAEIVMDIKNILKQNLIRQ